MHISIQEEILGVLWLLLATQVENNIIKIVIVAYGMYCLYCSLRYI